MKSIYGPLRKMVEVDVTQARIDEAKRALTNICHHMNCPGLSGTDISEGEPETCWQGDGRDQGPCLRIYQWRRIRNLERKLERLLAK